MRSMNWRVWLITASRSTWVSVAPPWTPSASEPRVDSSQMLVPAPSSTTSTRNPSSRNRKVVAGGGVVVGAAGHSGGVARGWRYSHFHDSSPKVEGANVPRSDMPPGGVSPHASLPVSGS